MNIDIRISVQNSVLKIVLNSLHQERDFHKRLFQKNSARTKQARIYILIN